MVVEWWEFTSLRRRGHVFAGFHSQHHRKLREFLEHQSAPVVDIKFSHARRLGDVFVCVELPAADADHVRQELCNRFAPWYAQCRRIDPLQ
jgi:hypothetical protein